MYPLFGAGDSARKRQINLGGAAAAASQAALLEQAKVRRSERDAHKRRADAAVHIQAWWRGNADGRRVRTGLAEIVRTDPRGVRGLRALALIGRDEQALAVWAAAMDSPGTYRHAALALKSDEYTQKRYLAL
jgi:ubiquitin-protein ligase E3 C